MISRSGRIALWTTMLALMLSAAPAMVEAKDYILTGIRPNALVLVDPAARKVERVYQIPGDGAPYAIATSPDGKVAYVMTNHVGSISGIDLDSGKQVFRADFSTDDVRVRATFGMDISPDGKELFVYHNPVKLGLDEYVVQDPYIAVYNTDDGLNAKPARTFPAPRRVMAIYMSTDGSKLYVLSWDIHVYDTKTGKLINKIKKYNWERENYIPPDTLNVWNATELSGIMAMPYFSVRTDLSADDPAAYVMGMATLDLSTGEWVMDDYEAFEVIIFSTVVNPARRNEVYGVYTTLSKIDINADKLIKRVDLPHTYYDVNVSRDGAELYTGGTLNDISIHSTETLDKIGTIELPGAMSISMMRIIER